MATYDSTNADAYDFDDDDGDTTLNPHKHPQRDFFIADIVDANIKDDMASMEFPLFALKAGDTKVRTFSNDRITMTIKPTADGIATIFDKDVWIYCISQLVEAQNRGKEISRTVRFTAYDFLVSTNRDTSGYGYKMLEKALARLKGTTIQTDIETGGKRQRNWFGLLDSAEIVEDDNNRMVAIEVTLSDWLYRSITSMSVLTLSNDYFRIRKPLHRRIYELARKHCGNQDSWKLSLELLHQKTGSQSSKKLFKQDIKAISESNDLPDYEVNYVDKTEQITFKKRQ